MVEDREECFELVVNRLVLLGSIKFGCEYFGSYSEAGESKVILIFFI